MVRDSREEWKTYNSVFDQFTNRLLFKLSSQNHFDEMKSIVGPGKEAVVFKAIRKDESPVAVKIYRLETANFTKMYSYIRVDPRYQSLKNNQRQVIFAWTEREYRNLLKAREAGVRCPTPIVHNSNILVMEWIGDEEPAPLLRHAEPEDVETFAKECFAMLEKFALAGMVHGDLSEYNILNHNDEPIFIDFSHSVLLKAPNSVELLERDIKNLAAYFRKLGVETDEKEFLKKILEKKE
jgi:RIO kinase 1